MRRLILCIDLLFFPKNKKDEHLYKYSLHIKRNDDKDLTCYNLNALRWMNEKSYFIYCDESRWIYC